MKIFVWLLILAVNGTAAAEDEPMIGRLFGRAGNHPVQDKATPAATRLHIDGAVARSSVAGTVWVNGTPMSRLDGPLRMEAHLDRMPEIVLHVPATLPSSAHRPAVVKVGETLDIEANHQSDLVPRGAVTARRLP